MLKVFLSYASEDRELVRPFFGRLKNLGFDPWMDVEKLLPGQQWAGAIDKGLREANVVILFISPRSVDKRGFVQREAKDALENLRLKRPDDIYLLPLILEKCEVPESIRTILQHIDISTPNAWDAVLKSLQLAAQQQKIVVMSGDAHGPYRVFSGAIKERKKGAPGHDIDVVFPRFVSESLPLAAHELTSFFEGRAVETTYKSRVKPWEQTPEDFPLFSENLDEDDQDFSWNMNGRWETFGVITATDRFLSVVIHVSWYGARAAHPNHFFETFNFAVHENSLLDVPLDALFVNWSVAAPALSEICIREITREYWRRAGEPADEQSLEWIKSGCDFTDQRSIRSCILGNGLRIFFAPYEVGPYAMSTFTVDVAYFEIEKYLIPGGLHTWAVANVVEDALVARISD